MVARIVHHAEVGKAVAIEIAERYSRNVVINPHEPRSEVARRRAFEHVDVTRRPDATSILRAHLDTHQEVAKSVPVYIPYAANIDRRGREGAVAFGNLDTSGAGGRKTARAPGVKSTATPVPTKTPGYRVLAACCKLRTTPISA